MCGIAGLADPRGVADEVLDRMGAALAHRGPDDAGCRTWADDGIGLAHRRLAIIDLSPAGKNPMANEDGLVWVVHNGEIYNHRELRRELELAGHRFSSRCDTEVLVHAYEEWGDDHVHRLRGMFAYAIYDRRRRAEGRAGPSRLVLVRDRLGIKPLHYAWDGCRLAFASEMKALMEVPDLDRAPDRTALADYLTYLCIPAPKSAYTSIRKLAPGELLVLEGRRVSTRRYWDVPLEPSPPDVGLDEAVGHLRGLLADAVGSHMISDVPIGLFLSGGIDSSGVAALAAEKSEMPVHAYSIGFDVPEHDETDHARLVAGHLGMEHRVRTVGVEAVKQALDRVSDMYDEPYADGSAVPTRRVAELARGDVKVALSGDGGDEVFGGYSWYRNWFRRRRIAALPPPARAFVAGLARLPRLRDASWLRNPSAEPLESYAGLLELFTPSQKRDALGPDVADELRGYDDYWSLRRYWREGVDEMTKLQYLDLKTYLPDDILTKVDRASMDVGLEVRPPLLDHLLVEAMFQLPSEIRLPADRPKGLLKLAVGDRLPREIVDRPKKGFSAPWNTWMHGLDTWALQELREGAAVQAGILSRDPLRSLGSGRRGPQLWSLLLLEQWCRRWL